MYIYTLYKHYCTFLYNFIVFTKPLLYIFINNYSHLFFLVILIIYNIFTTHYIDITHCDFPVFDYLPNYLKFNTFFHIHNFLDPSIYNQVFLDNDLDYNILSSSLDEIDYQILPNQEESFSYLKWEEHKPTFYMR